MESHDARMSKLEADFKQKQEEMSSKIDTVLKAITGQLVGTLPSDTIKNPIPIARNPTSQPPREQPDTTPTYGSINVITKGVDKDSNDNNPRNVTPQPIRRTKSPIRDMTREEKEEYYEEITRRMNTTLRNMVIVP